MSSLHDPVRCFNQITSDYLRLRVNTEIVLLLLINESSSQTRAGGTCNVPGMSSNHPDIALDILLRQGVDIRVRLRLLDSITAEDAAEVLKSIGSFQQLVGGVLTAVGEGD
ncbi:hypothetical protein NDI42_22700 [Funiculus sociatus GB2-C1]|nr:hypothetical protein [Trichocoleus sp. FACHB-69]